MSEYIETAAWRIQHSDKEFYCFKLNSEILLEISYVSENERDKGVQRPLSERRCKEVGKYIDSDHGVFANNVILNLPNDIIYEPEENNENQGVLKIPNRPKSTWVVDGQHRLFGFNYADKEFELLCTGFVGLEVEDQAEIFITINTKQKGIPASVIYDLLPVVKDAEFKKKRAHSLVSQFNDDPDSPWYNNIKMLGVGKGLVSQSTFANNLEKLIDPNGGVLASYNEQFQFKILLNYFNAFNSIFNNEWGNRKFVLTKTVGIAAMCGIFPKVHELCNKNFKTENIIIILNNIRDFDFSSEVLGKSTNNVAIQNVINDLLQRLPDVNDVSDIQV